DGLLANLNLFSDGGEVRNEYALRHTTPRVEYRPGANQAAITDLSRRLGPAIGRRARCGSHRLLAEHRVVIDPHPFANTGPRMHNDVVTDPTTGSDHNVALNYTIVADCDVGRDLRRRRD
ncbi:MAG: hypothetical protein AAFQ53_11275, partial [Bacteroidota bacterium]